MKKRNIVLMVFLYIFTFGIYPLYWFCSFQNQLKKTTGLGFTGGIHLLMFIITFGIYGIYWQYAAGKRLAILGAKDRSIMYLLFSIFFIGFINPFLMQSQANQL